MSRALPANDHPRRTVMNSITNTWFQLPVDIEATRAFNLNSLGKPSCTDERQGRTGSVTNPRTDPAPEAANEVNPEQIQESEGPSAVVHYGHACLTHRFEAWLHGSQVLEAPLRARYLDSPEHQAEALAGQRRAVREDSYVPAGTPLLLM
jgi:hypothetical protein